MRVNVDRAVRLFPQQLEWMPDGQTADPITILPLSQLAEDSKKSAIIV